MEKQIYQTPLLEVVETTVELGFSSSTNVEDPIEDDTSSWGKWY